VVIEHVSKSIRNEAMASCLFAFVPTQMHSLLPKRTHSPRFSIDPADRVDCGWVRHAMVGPEDGLEHRQHLGADGGRPHALRNANVPLDAPCDDGLPWWRNLREPVAEILKRAIAKNNARCFLHCSEYKAQCEQYTRISQKQMSLALKV
jgi:hypothetical protein